MTQVLFAKIPESLCADALACFVRKSFPHKGNEEYFDALERRKSTDSVKESFAALALLRELLSMRGIETDRLVFRRSESGKPYFKDRDLHFSLSHSKGYVAAALSDSTRVGIDIECADVPRDRAEKMIKRFFSEGRTGDFSTPSHAAEPPTTDDISHTAENFVRIWTKAEAYAKMTGTGLGKVIKNTQLPHFYTEEEQGRVVFEYYNADGYPLTACLEKADGEIDFFKTDLENLIKKAEI